MINREYRNQFKTRIAMASLLLFACVLMLVFRAVQLNVLNKDFLQQEGDARYLRVVNEPANRGMITDRNGEPLAISTPVESVWANPKELLQAGPKLRQLADVIGADYRMLVQLLRSRVGREFFFIRRHVDPDLVEAITKLEIPGVGFQREYRRYYPSGEVAAQVVGFTNIDDKGQEGIELALDKRLAGQAGSKRVLKDRLGHIVENVENVKSPQAGNDVILSLDRRIQYLAFRELKKAVIEHKAESGSVVLIDVETGGILAMTNYPSFNPNNRPSQDNAFIRNRAITDVFEPGSTVKPFTIAAGLETGIFSVNSVIDTTPGLFRVGRKTIRDHRNYGAIDLQTVIQKSSNVGASKVALSIEPRWLWKVLSSVGFGSSTGSIFPGESVGTLTNYSGWNKIERASLSFGYGLSVTALQLARAYSVFASSDGQLKPMTLIRNTYADNKDAGTGIGISRQTLRQVRQMLETVVSQDGTGNKAAIEGYRVAGKTGTVKKLGKNGYLDNSYRALFAGIAPASNPRLVMVVMIDDPKGKEYYGGRVAAPVFSVVMSGALRMLNIQPDDFGQPQDPRVALLENIQ